MTPTLDLHLSRDEARLLADHLQRHLEHLDAELVRTDKHELQHALAGEIAALEIVSNRLKASMTS